MNTKKIGILFLTVLMIGWASTAFTKVSATVDRANIVVDETLTLTIIKDKSSFFTDPDLEPLQKDFKVVGQSQQSSTQIINGTTTSTVSWQITLAPKRAGTLSVPPLSVGKEKTNSLTVRVSAEAQVKTRADNAPIFIETDVDEESVFVQSQLIFTLRIYGAVTIQIIDPGIPDVSDALIEKLDDATFDKVIDGTSYRVFERKYALFPQKSGVLKIPQMVVQVQIPSRRSRRNFFDPFGNQGEILKFRSTGHEVTVRGKPGEYPAAAVWLPASGFTVKEQWVQDPQSLEVGESATLNLSLIAEGLMAQQLPPIEMVEPDGMKVYQGKAEVENIITATGILGTRKESIALIPTHPGEVEIPEIRIPWWNKINGKVEYAVIPAGKFVVRGSGRPQEKTLQETEPRSGTPAVPEAQMLQQQSTVQQTRPTVLIILSAVLAVTWLITLFMLFQTRRQLRALVLEQKGDFEQEQTVKERQALKALAEACRDGDPAQARAAVMSWTRAFLPEEDMQTLGDITRIFPDSELPSLLGEIDSVLYSRGESSGQWQGDRLLAQVKKIRKEYREKKKDKEGLQELYK